MSEAMSALDALASRAGIQRSFRDARGDLKTADDPTLRALLAAMGISAADETAAQTAFAELERAEWGKLLPPVIVVRESARSIIITLHLSAGTEMLDWRIGLENGPVLTGKVRVDQLKLEATGEAGRERRRLVLDEAVPTGYHTLEVGSQNDQASLIVTPDTCWLPPGIEAGRRMWGVSAQLYLLRSAGNWGIGDYGDLARFAGDLGARGADVIGVNPLHAMFLDAPEQASPYSPASRLLLNVLNIDVGALPELIGCEPARALIDAAPFQERLATARAVARLDYRAVVDLKLPVLRLLFGYAQSDPTSPRWRAFQDFRQASGATFERGAQFLALREHFSAQTPACADWHDWPVAYRNPASAEVTHFIAEHADQVAFQAWLQFAADVQLGFAAHAARPMAVGLYRDLAVGADRSGAETWANQTAVVAQAQVGAPPDIYNPAGQGWGLPPFNPRALRAEGYRSFIELVRANMRHAGGLRIDHVMGLQQLYWVPEGHTPGEGAFVRYPLEDLVGILALESRRNRCLVVGEDLGTVAEGFRERMAAAHILSYRVLFFEKDADGFVAPEGYPALSVAVAGSHDLPTLRGWWESGDLELKKNLHLFPTAEDAQRATRDRETDRADLTQALLRVGFRVDAGTGIDALVLAVHTYLARSRSAFALMQVDDIADEASPVNVPSTSDEHPNWRRRQSLSLEELERAPRLAALADIFRRERSLSDASR